MSYFWIMDPRWATVYHLRAGHHPDYVPALARCSTPERLFWSANRVGPSAPAMGVTTENVYPPPARRCASATKIVRPARSRVATQPQLQPALLRSSAIFSQ